MPYSLSPGVTVSEIDLTTIVPSVSTSIGAFAGHFRWGPINEVVNISNEAQLVDRFLKPDSNNYISFFSAANFLAYANNLRVVRADAPGLKNAGTGGGTLIKNQIDYDSNYSTGSSAANTVGPFVAKFAGAIGNSIRYSMIDANTTAYTIWEFKDQVSTAPGTSPYVSSLNGSNDEIHLVVTDSTGLISGVKNSILEKYEFLSRAIDAKNSDGSTNYYKNVVNNKSKYLRWVRDPLNTQLSGSSATGNVYSNVALGGTFTVSSGNLTSTLSGGVDATPVTANVQNAYSYFTNADDVDVSLIITGQHDSTVINYCTSSIAEVRKDCVVFASPKQTDVVDQYGIEVTNILTSRNTLTSSSYTFLDSGWKYQYDKYNDTYRYIPLNADIAGLCAKTDQDRDPWFSPGGLNRGTIKNVVKLAFNPSKAQRDLLYVDQVNPVVTFPGQGTVLFGDKTLQVKPSAFDRINVRRLFITLEKAIARASRYSLFEQNDAFTRAQFISLVEPYLRDVQGRRGILDFRVVCDDTNNTSEVIDRNEFIGDIYIKPTRSINFIQLNFVATKTGVNFDEIVGKF